jgi:hypothetical protein
MHDRTPFFCAGETRFRGLPSYMRVSRVHDPSGKRIGFYGDSRFSKGCIALCDFEADAVVIKLVPIDLDLNRAHQAERGLLAWPAPDLAREIADDMARMMEIYAGR